MPPKRLRLFAGPNGSGKTTIVEKISRDYNLGFIVNADDIEKRLKLEGSYSLKEQDIYATTEMMKDYIREEGFSMQKISDLHYVDSISVTEQQIQLPVAFVNSYVAADIAGFIREKHIENSYTFTFESVLSHPSKLDLLRSAKLKGYRIYLY